MNARDSLQRQWQDDGLLSRLLAPLSWLAGLAVRRKHEAYRSGRRTAWRAPVPVVVVGNLYVGGTGKTPVVIAIAQGLHAQGWTPGVVSRGYGARVGSEPRVGMGADLDPAAYGDEPALIARAAAVPVAVHPRRVLAAQALLRACPGVDVIIADDGLQHLQLARDVEIVVQDERGLGNGRMLPAGPLREPPSRLNEVDVVVTNLGSRPADLKSTPSEPDANAMATGLRSPRAGPVQLSMRLEPGAARCLADGNTRPLADFAAGPPVAAAAGIGNPQRFFDTLRAAGIALAETLPLPDHYAYDESPFGGLQSGQILVTAKDAIKCARLDDARLWEVGVQARFEPFDLTTWLNAAIVRKTDRNRG
ncbi:tetraacyldisaccharide 4'-kinase [Bordetella sp. FB-8]|uniref:tetraacyldisaccharide 4'-kinase n=1 Tax=Bordetella sp. FB-8 TaxID=1159870 RepID=UPI000366F105|nr:tetraacyldisaccharide 4'-kinase [Bordetella sp. FB-8]